MRRINEIFYSLQGEGAHTGVPAVFIRFSGCNLQCTFCDTKHAEGVEMTDSEIVAYVNTYPGEWIILTGGEPSLWIDENFIHTLHVGTGKKIAIETNGTRPVPSTIDWITFSPKFGMTAPPSAAESAVLRLARADEIKVVDVGQELEPYFHMPQVRSNTLMFLQPCWVDNPKDAHENEQRTVRRVLADTRWRLSLQIHRKLGIN